MTVLKRDYAVIQLSKTVDIIIIFSASS